MNRYATLLALLVILAACAKNPVTGRKQLVLISEAQEISYGQASHPEVLAEFGETESAELQRYFGRIGQKMAEGSHRPRLPWRFTVLDSPVVNAFAAPGGFIYFTRGILSRMNNEAELAGVLGHEIGHVSARHSVAQITQQQLLGLGMGIGTVFSPTFRQFSEAAQFGLGLLFLKFTRDDERQADELGVRYVYQQGYDPRRISDFFEVFESTREESGNALPNWLSSHPAPPDRVAATLRQAEQILQEDGPNAMILNEKEFLTHLDGVVYEDNPREGFEDAGTFFHPDLEFLLKFPPTWKVINTRSSVVFGDPEGQAIIHLTIVPPQTKSPEERVRQLEESPDTRLVEGGPETIHGNPAYVGTFEVTQSTGELLGARAAFISFGGSLYQLVGFSRAERFREYRPQFDETLTSFRRLTDRRILSVQPDRIRLYEVQRGGTLRHVAQRYPNPRVDLAELSRLNRIGTDERLSPGRLVKVVEAGRR